MKSYFASLVIVFMLGMLSYSQPSFATNCKVNNCENFPIVTEIAGIYFPLSLMQKRQNLKPTNDNYYIYHWQPIKKNMSPYVVMLPSSGGITQGSAKTYFRYSQKLLKLGFGVVIVDIFQNSGVEKGTVSRGPLASMAALSALNYIKEDFSEFSNGKFGVLGESRGGMTVLSLASEAMRKNHLYKNVNTWFDAGVAFYPSCGEQELTMPVQIFIGDLDEWVSADGCKSWLSSASELVSQGKLNMNIYEGVHHLFNRETNADLTLSNSQSHDLGGRASLYNKDADLDSENKMLSFFSSHLLDPQNHSSK